jgi:hypothetical protein
MTQFFSIPKPCSENWNEMDATAQGAFCAKCTKEVVDCTTIKTSEVKATLATKENPCVRIFAEQIDEMNFLEWFGSISLKKQLKYAFLFAYLMVFSTNGNAQDTVATPQIITVDTNFVQAAHIESDSLKEQLPIDSLTEQTLHDSIADTTTQIIDTTLTTQIVKEEEEVIITLKEDAVSSIGTIAWQPFMGNIAYEVECGPTMGFTVSHSGPYFGDASRSPFLDENSKFPPIVKDSPHLSLNNSRYSFQIEGDSLRFFAYALNSERIRIKISKKGKRNPFYFRPIQLERGATEILFPLNDFENGVYIVTVEGEESSSAIELVYW